LPDLTTLGFAYGGYCAWALGLTEKARVRMAKAIVFARDSQSPFELAQALAWESAMYTSLREPERAEAAATRAFALCEEGGFLQMAEVARVHLGWARAQLGSAGEGVALLRRGVAGLLELKTKTGITAQLTYLAEALALDGALTDALSTIEDALEANPDEAVTRPDAFTLRGELQLKMGKRGLAEADFSEAIALAQKTSAKTMELRATMSLARLLRHTNRRDEARTMLAAIYNWFTEGFDTCDLRDAKALLDELC
jgi:tetratricopeptide (TPR) repeat protein